MSQTIELAITGMTCDHCVRAITNAVEDVDGVTSATVDLASNSAKVEGGAIDIKKILEAIEEEGYSATVKA